MPESITQSVGGKLVAKSATFTRPANATAYTAGDVVSNSTSASVLMTFGDGLARLAGGSGVIVKARLATDKITETAQYRLYLYTVASLTAIPNDNAPDTTLYLDKASEVGFIDFPVPTGGAGTNTAVEALWTGGVGSATEPAGLLAFVCAVGSTSLYGKLVNITGTTPASGQSFFVELTALQN